MAVYRRGYQRYQGAVTGHAARLLVLPRFAWQRLLQQRLIVILLVAALFWPVGCADTPRERREDLNLPSSSRRGGTRQCRGRGGLARPKHAVENPDTQNHTTPALRATPPLERRGKLKR